MLEGGGSGSTSGYRPASKPAPRKTPRLSVGAAIGKAAGRASSKIRRKSTSSRSSRSRGSSSGSSGRGSGYSSGGGSGRNLGGGSDRSIPTPVTAPKPVLKPPSIGSYLGTDSAYQQAVRSGKRSLQDFLSEIGRRRGESETQYGQTTASMERDRTQQLDELRQEFASRGLINSGLFGEEQGKFQKQFSEQATALKNQQASLLADLLSQQTNYTRENELALEQAKQEALLRRAQKYKIGA